MSSTEMTTTVPVSKPAIRRAASMCGLLPRPAIMLGAMLLVAITLLMFSPNFDPAIADRDAPLGSDFLQEWVGGHIWLSDQSASLYSAEHYVAVQHDADIVGFTFPDNMYYPMVYPPFYYMLLSPLALVPYQQATAIWLIGLSVFAAATVYCFSRFFQPARQHWGKCLFSLIAFYPFMLSLNTAHKSIVLLFIVSSTFLLLHHRKPFSAGAVFGMIAFKPHLGIVIGLAMLAKGQWRFVTGCLLTVAVLVGCSAIAGIGLCEDYFLQFASLDSYSQNEGYRLAESHNLSGALQLSLGNTIFATVVWAVLSLAIAGVAVFCLKGKLDFQSPRFAMQFSTLVIATILLSPHFYTYDLTILWLPIALILITISRSDIKGLISRARTVSRSRFLLFPCIGLFVVAGVATSIAEQFHFQPTMPLLITILVGIWQLTAQRPIVIGSGSTALGCLQMKTW